MDKNDNNSMNFKQGKEPRNQLELPTLHFIVTDQWTDVLTEKAIFSWLRMYSWCKRDEENAEVNLWEQSKVPFSFSKVKEKLKVGNDTFYNKILKPLWNVGLIDIEEWGYSENKGTKPMNLIIYKYPQNSKALEYEPIKEIRNYDTDYNSKARTFAKKGGRPKKQGGSQIEHPPVPKENTPLFSNRTPPRSNIEHINRFNSISNSLNTLNNILNSISNNLNSSSSNVVGIKQHKDKQTKRKEEEEGKIIKICDGNIVYEILGEYLHNKKIQKETIMKTILECNKRDLDIFTMEDMEEQYKFMMEMKSSGERIYDFAKFFANGLKDLTEQSNSNEVYQQEKIREYEIAKKERQERDPIIYYNWLEE